MDDECIDSSEGGYAPATGEPVVLPHVLEESPGLDLSMAKFCGEWLMYGDCSQPDDGSKFWW
jgi:hypothetical protein